MPNTFVIESNNLAQKFESIVEAAAKQDNPERNYCRENVSITDLGTADLLTCEARLSGSGDQDSIAEIFHVAVTSDKMILFPQLLLRSAEVDSADSIVLDKKTGKLTVKNLSDNPDCVLSENGAENYINKLHTALVAS